MLLAVGCRDFVGPDNGGADAVTSVLSATAPGVNGVLRGSGLPGLMIVDPATRPGTAVTSFEQISASCARFSGTGWIDTGHLWQFFIDVCDNATPGAGFDTFAITLPDRVAPGVPYARSGTLSDGDIVLRGGS